MGRLGRKKKRARGAFPARFLFLSIIDILMGIPSGSLCGGERDCSQSRPIHVLGPGEFKHPSGYFKRWSCGVFNHSLLLSSISVSFLLHHIPLQKSFCYVDNRAIYTRKNKTRLT